MSDLVKNDAQVQTALDKLLAQFKNSTKLKELFSAILSPLQTTEDDLIDLSTNRWPDSAEGEQLDNLGAIVGQPREGKIDPIYRLWIKARIYVNRSTGVPSDTLNILALVVDPDTEYHLIEQPPAGYLVELWNVNPVNYPSIFDLLLEVKPAGVRLHSTYSDQPLTGLFRYDTVGQGFDGSAVYAGDLDG